MIEGSSSTRQASRPDLSEWKAAVAGFQKPDAAKASWQIINTVGAYLLTWVLLYFVHDISWWLTVPLAILAGGLLVRVFIIFHDCGHGSTFKSRKANQFWGTVCGFLTFTPYSRWRWEHGRHHATSGNLDRRGIGDVWTLTVAEYQQSSRWRRLAYRVVRNPLILFLVGPLVLMIFIERLPSANGHVKERRSVWVTNAVVGLLVTGLILTFGLVPYLIIQLIILSVAGSAGVWLFYVQHQYEHTYWAREDEWDYVAAALQGSSYYRLPRVLQWFSGNIGFHHIHHLNPAIANYHLQSCHESSALLQSVPSITLLSSLKSLKYRLWDESGHRLVSYRQMDEMLSSSAAA